MSEQVAIEIVEAPAVSVEVVEEGVVEVVEIIHPGPQGPIGPDGAGLPTGGNPGDIIIKSSYANGDADWAPTLDGGTFF